MRAALLRSVLLVLIAVVGFVVAADAATLSVSPDKTTYLVGERITLTVIGDDQGAVSDGIFGRLEYVGAPVNIGTQSQTRLIGVSGPWTTLILRSGSDVPIEDHNFSGPSMAVSDAFHQRSATGGEETADNLPGVLSTVTLIAQAVGVVDVSWYTEAGPGQLNFFGLTSAPGTSFTIVPEPGTAALFALALLGLAGWRMVRD